MAVNPATGDLYVVYNDKGTGADKGDIFLRESTDGGATWGAALRVNDDATTRDQFMPTVAVTPNGAEVGVFWYDRRLDPANNLIDRYGQIYATTGSTLTPAGPNVRITDQSFLPEFNRDSLIAASYMGDYDQAAASNNYFYLTWGDNRDNLTLAGAGSRKDPNVRFAQVLAAAAGPTVVNSAPAGNTFAPVSSIRFTFDRVIDPMTFTTGQHRQLHPHRRLDGHRRQPRRPRSHQRRRLRTTSSLTFTSPPRPRWASYSTDHRAEHPATRCGNPMDQNHNLIAGEIPGDDYTAAFTHPGAASRLGGAQWHLAGADLRTSA